MRLRDPSVLICTTLTRRKIFRACCTMTGQSSRRDTIQREIEGTRKGGRPNTKWEDNISSLIGAMGDGVTTGPGPRRRQRTKIDYL